MSYTTPPEVAEGFAGAAATTIYGLPGLWNWISVSTSALSAGTDYYGPFIVTTPITVDRLVTEVDTGSAGNVRIGIYAATKGWQPVGAPLADSGNISTTAAAVKTYDPGTALYLAPGRYLTIINCDNAGASFRIYRGGGPQWVLSSIGGNPFINEWAVARTYAAFPTPGTAWTTPSVGTTPFRHYVLLRVSAP